MLQSSRQCFHQVPARLTFYFIFFYFELSRLMSMLDYPVLKNNAHLMDKMFTCLAHASAGIPLIESATL